MKRIRSVLSLFFVFSLTVCQADQSGNGGRLCRYRITSRGLGVGELKTVISPAQHAGGRAFRFRSELSIDANLLLFHVRKSGREEALVSEHGTLSYHRQGEENGRSTTVDAHLEDGVFRFRIGENRDSRQVSVPRGSYDFTTMDCPETTMKREGDTLEVRLLDMEHARVVTRKFHWLRSEEVEVGGRRLNCRVVEFSDPNNDCRRWVSGDERGVIIVRQDGKGRGSGNYSLHIVSVENAPG